MCAAALLPACVALAPEPRAGGESTSVAPPPIWVNVIVREPPDEYVSPPTTSGALSPVEQGLFDRIQRVRSANGVGPLALDANLLAAARAHSREMAELHYFSHTSPTPEVSTPVLRFLVTLRESGQIVPSYVLVGENIYHTSELAPETGVESAHRALLASPSHRRTILSPSYAFVGVGAYQTAGGALWVTEMFLRVTPWTDEDLDPVGPPGHREP